MRLIIAEKPSVAHSIAAVIEATEKRDGYMEGNSYLVSWYIGHLVSFADADHYDERSKSGAMRICPLSRSNGSTSFLMTRKSSLTPSS